MGRGAGFVAEVFFSEMIKTCDYIMRKRIKKELKEYENNPSEMTEEEFERLGYTMESFGDLSGIVFNTKEEALIGGHKRLRQIKKEHGEYWIEITRERDHPVFGHEKYGYVVAGKERWAYREVCWNDKMSVPARLVANKLHGDFVQDRLDVELQKAIDLEIDLNLTGFGINEINIKIDESDVPEQKIDKANELNKKWKVKNGDLWEIGNHLLYCGDCRNLANIDRLLVNELVDCMITDPPYGVDYSEKNEFLNKYDDGNRIQKEMNNDNIKDYRMFFYEFLKNVPFANYNTFYIFMLGKELHNLRLAIEDSKYMWGDYLVWVKNNHVLGRKDYNTKHEFIVYGWKGKHKFYGGFKTTVLNFDKPLKSDLHFTAKPIELVLNLMGDGSFEGAVMYDPFLGSGTTMIAAELMKRKCRAFEISPEYCAVTLERMAEMGLEPELINS